jgi:aspartyl-tRNA(Asn)/glutamyl-tRNA(Gln) amidotransferase subunit C
MTPSTMLTREEVLKIASLARLKLSDQEIEFYQKRLGRILGYVEELNAVDAPTNAMARYIPKDCVTFREDRPVPFEDPHELLKNAPAAEADSFLIPQVMD